MFRLALASGFAAVVDSACVQEAGGFKFDFSSLEGKQLSYTEREYTYTFTFCTTAPCSGLAASLCQSDPSFTSSLGTWSNISGWTAPDSKTLKGTMTGEECFPDPRRTALTFQCVNGPAAITSIVEAQTCVYEANINVPMSVCQQAKTCCAPPTYAYRRLAVAGGVVVVQRDSSGQWYDSDFEGRGKKFLCSPSYNRCFEFTATQCTVSAYRSPPAVCYNDGWVQRGDFPLVDFDPLTQTVLASSIDQSYVVTIPLGDGCVAVSGSNIDTSFDFRPNPDASLWVVPDICLRTPM